MKKLSRFLRFPEVRHLTGLSRSTIWRYEREGRFPQRIQIGDNAVGWDERDILTWMSQRREIVRGLRELDAGRGVPHAKVRQRFRTKR